jgi:hypothetical protein
MNVHVLSGGNWVQVDGETSRVWVKLDDYPAPSWKQVGKIWTLISGAWVDVLEFPLAEPVIDDLVSIPANNGIYNQITVTWSQPDTDGPVVSYSVKQFSYDSAGENETLVTEKVWNSGDTYEFVFDSITDTKYSFEIYAIGVSGLQSSIASQNYQTGHPQGNRIIGGITIPDPAKPEKANSSW